MAATSHAKELNVTLDTTSTTAGDDHKIVISRSVGLNYKQELFISIRRTIRVMDNGEDENHLPPDRGCFPIYLTEDYKKDLPLSMALKTGYFIPMYRQ